MNKLFGQYSLQENSKQQRSKIENHRGENAKFYSIPVVQTIQMRAKEDVQANTDMGVEENRVADGKIIHRENSEKH